MEYKFTVGKIEFVAVGWADDMVAEQHFSWGTTTWARITNGEYQQMSKTHELLRRAGISTGEFERAFRVATGIL